MWVFVVAFNTMTLTSVSSSQGQVQSDTKDTFPRTSWLLLSFNRRHGNALSTNHRDIPNHSYVCRMPVQLLKYLPVVSEITYSYVHMTC